MVFDKDEILKQLISRMCTYPMLKSLCSLVFYLPGGFSDSLNVVCTSSFPLERSSFSRSDPSCQSAASTWPFTSSIGQKIQAGGTRVGVSQRKRWCNSLIFQEGNALGTTHGATATS